MASETKQPKFLPVEYERAYDAYGEWKLKGHTELTCLHCGKGRFQFLEIGNSVEIKCETSGCVVARIRGI